MRRQVLGLSVYHWGRLEVKVAVGFLDWLLFSVSGITGAAGVVQKVALLCLTF